MKLPRLFLQIVFIFFAQSIFAQQNGTLFLSTETLKNYAYSYEMDQYRLEHFFSERFSNSGWKYHPGDDSRWKETSYDDSDWTIFSTDFNLNNIPQGTWQGIGWFRLKLIIDSSLYDQQIALVMTHYGASEIYVDGKLINQYGIPAKNHEDEKTFRPLFLEPVLISLGDKPEHLLAIRYSFQNANKLFDKYGNVLWHINDQNGSAGFTVHFGHAKEQINLFSDSLKKNLLCATITFCTLFLIGNFHLFLFWFFSRDRSNLYLAIFNLTLAVHSLIKFLPTYTHLNLQLMMLDNFFGIILSCFWIPVTMFAYYSVFYSKLPRYLWLYLTSTPLLAYTWIFNHSLGGKIILWISLIAFLDMMRLFVKSVIKKDRYVWIVGIGVLLSQFTLILYFFPSVTLATRAFLVYPVFLAVPISLSIFNAIRTAATSISLENQLDEIKRLSKLSLTQEQDKQQILTSQKEILERQVTERTSELKQSLDNLKTTQSQLIQSEKMASLGELTAGIAHEIQNPLNFVNNFSEVNKELLTEMKDEMDKGNLSEAKSIAGDVIENEEKINHHGKRADAIVKGMLQHTRSSSGVKEPTDINSLANEYFRLSYQGLRARDKSFNATLETDFDPTIEKINIVAQDIGRVLLNLYNNAFYAVNEKKIRGPEGYCPTVSVSTKKIDGKVGIRVKDNGNGIPQKALDKIFQPFFTTKPTGQGTGLGLSLVYDIIKAHGGELKVETNESEGAEFIIQLPIV